MKEEDKQNEKDAAFVDIDFETQFMADLKSADLVIDAIFDLNQTKYETFESITGEKLDQLLLEFGKLPDTFTVLKDSQKPVSIKKIKQKLSRSKKKQKQKLANMQIISPDLEECFLNDSSIPPVAKAADINFNSIGALSRSESEIFDMNVCQLHPDISSDNRFNILDGVASQQKKPTFDECYLIKITKTDAQSLFEVLNILLNFKLNIKFLTR